MAKPNWKNRTLFHGDNLEFMRAMNSESIDLIATDPPFNKGRDFHATPDSLASGASFQDRWSWENDVHEDWLDQISDDHPNLMDVIQNSRKTYGDDMGAYLCFMAVRLIAMRRLLKPTGSIYLHCDPTASHYLKMLMDAILGKKNFVNEIIWFYKTGGTSKRWFGKKHDVLLFYSKSKSYTFNLQKEKSYLSHRYGFSNIELFEDERGTYTRVGMRDVWDIPALRGNQPETVGYPTQKPLSIYNRVIRASSDEGDVVLDPFAGCATTCVAAERLRRNWVGIDIWDKASDVVVERLEKEGLAAPKYTRKTKKARQQYLFAEEFTFTDKLPKRTDDGETDVPYLKVKSKLKVDEKSDGLSNKERKQKLLETKGSICQGCGRKFDDHRYLELDHNTPRADGGSNNLFNRILLCSPCNRLKSHTYTLSGLIKENKKQQYMVNLKLVDALRK